MNTLDPHLNVKAQARAVLAILSERDPDFAVFKDGQYHVEFTTWAWYNGRERGICISMQKDICAPAIHMVFGECRSSDDIFVSWWATKRPYFNGPSVGDCPEIAYKSRRIFKHGACGEVAEYLYVIMQEAYKDLDRFLKRETREMDEVAAQTVPEIADAWDKLRG